MLGFDGFMDESKECSGVANMDEPVLVVLAANEKYVPVLYTCIQSVVCHVTPGRKYKIYIFHTDIQTCSQKHFQTFLARTYVQIYFINVKKRVSGYQLKAKQHITTETFYRFLILDLLKDHSKAVYLDCDTIVCRDIAQLYDTPMERYLVAAVRDADFAGQCNRKDSGMREYCRNVLGLKDPFQYFQAGVIIWNISMMRREVSVSKLFEMADTGIYRFSDQDILNVVCRGRVKYLDMAWNVLSDSGNFRWQNVIRYAPYSIQKEYKNARKQPYLIHYAGYLKPWIRPDEDFAYEFWKTARETVYYKQILQEMCQKASERQFKNLRKKVFLKLKELVKRLLPEGSRLRNCAIRMYLRTISE